MGGFAACPELLSLLWQIFFFYFFGEKRSPDGVSHKIGTTQNGRCFHSVVIGYFDLLIYDFEKNLKKEEWCLQLPVTTQLG